MSNGPPTDGLRALPVSPTSLRFTALYGTQTDITARRSRRVDASPVADFFTASPTRPSYREWMSAAADQLPTVADLRGGSGDAVNLEAAASLLRVDSCWTWTFDVGDAGFVLAIALDVTLRDTVTMGEAAGALFEDFDTNRNSRRVEDRPLGSDAKLALGFDFHAVIALPDALRTRLSAETVQELVSRRWHLSLPRFVTASLEDPRDGFPDGVVAVTPGASVVCGIGADSAMAAIVCAAQATSAAAALRDLHHEVYRTAVAVARPAADAANSANGSTRDPRALEATARELADYELDLSLAVERFAEMRLFVPVWRIERYHKLLLDALGVDRATAVTATMLERVLTAVTARQSALDSERWRQTERRRRSLSAVAGASAFIAIPLTITIGFLGINVSPVGHEGSALRGQLLPYYLGLLALLTIAVASAWWHVRRQPDDVINGPG